MLRLPHATWVHDSLLLQAHREGQMRVRPPDDISLEAWISEAHF